MYRERTNTAKSIKIDGYKGMFEMVEGSDPVEHNVNIPFNQSLLSLQYIGIAESNFFV